MESAPFWARPRDNSRGEGGGGYFVVTHNEVGVTRHCVAVQSHLSVSKAASAPGTEKEAEGSVLTIKSCITCFWSKRMYFGSFRTVFECFSGVKAHDFSIISSYF